MTKLLTITEVAPLLGKTPNGVRELLGRSRRAAAGRPVRGATIRFLQDGKGGTIRFRSEWVEEYLDRTTIDPDAPAVAQARRAPRRSRRPVISWDDI